MLHFSIYIIYSTTFATILSDIARQDFEWGVLASSFVWVVGIAISFIPVLRTIILAIALITILPWWWAIPLTIVVNFLRWLILMITDPVRKERLKENEERFKRSVEELNQ